MNFARIFSVVGLLLLRPLYYPQVSSLLFSADATANANHERFFPVLDWFGSYLVIFDSCLIDEKLLVTTSRSQLGGICLLVQKRWESFQNTQPLSGSDSSFNHWPVEGCQGRMATRVSPPPDTDTISFGFYIMCQMIIIALL